MFVRIVCIIQARMGSTRLPGKVAMDISGKTMLERVVERARGIDGVNEVVVATSTAASDDVLVGLCATIGSACFRGSEEDVLDRYLGAAHAYNAQIVVRVTSDCPLLDPAVSSVVVRRFIEEQPDYATNSLDPTYLRGMDTEVIPKEGVPPQARRREAALGSLGWR